MHISIFHSVQAPLDGHRFAYGTLAEDYQGDDVIAKVVFFNGTAQIAGRCNVNINKGLMPSSEDIIKAYVGRQFTLLDNQAIVDELQTALKAESKKRAQGVAHINLAVLAGEVLHWRQLGCLPESGKFRDLARICAEYTSSGSEYQEAERLVEIEALKFARSAR